MARGKKDIPYYQNEIVRIDKEIVTLEEKIKGLKGERKETERTIDDLKKQALFQKMTEQGLSVDELIKMVDKQHVNGK